MREAGDSRKLIAAQMLPFSLSTMRAGLKILWERAVKIGRHREKRLRLCESLPLGERRFVAVVEFEKTRFLVGGTATSLVLLSRLGEEALRGAELGEINPGEINRDEISRAKKRESEPC
jgi:flagellar biogenesis protein FliO